MDNLRKTPAKLRLEHIQGPHGAGSTPARVRPPHRRTIAALLLAGVVTAAAGLSLACRGSSDAGETDNGSGLAPTSVTTLFRSDAPPPSKGQGGGAGISTPFPGAPADLLANPAQVAIDDAGNIFVTDFDLRVIKRIDTAGNMTVFAGNGEDAYVDGPASEASFMGPRGLAFGPDGRLYVTDTLAHRVRVVERDGTVSTVAGSGPTGFAEGGGFADGRADEAMFASPAGIAVAKDGTIYVADQNNHRVRRISPDGDVVTFAGSDQPGVGDGPRGVGQLDLPVAIALASDGYLYATELAFSSLRQIAPDGTIATIVPWSRPGEGLLRNPAGIAVDSDGLLWVADAGNHRIVQLTTDGDVIATFGSGSPGLVDGPTRTAAFSRPVGIAFLPDGSLVVVDQGNRAIRKIQ